MKVYFVQEGQYSSFLVCGIWREVLVSSYRLAYSVCGSSSQIHCWGFQSTRFWLKEFECGISHIWLGGRAWWPKQLNIQWCVCWLGYEKTWWLEWLGIWSSTRRANEAIIVVVGSLFYLCKVRQDETSQGTAWMTVCCICEIWTFLIDPWDRVLYMLDRADLND